LAVEMLSSNIVPWKFTSAEREAIHGNRPPSWLSRFFEMKNVRILRRIVLGTSKVEVGRVYGALKDHQGTTKHIRCVDQAKTSYLIFSTISFLLSEDSCSTVCNRPKGTIPREWSGGPSKCFVSGVIPKICRDYR
jgi:hypothetical protein